MGDWMGPRTGLHVLNNRNISPLTGINVNFSLLLAMKLLRGVEIMVFCVLISTIDGVVKLRSCLGRFGPGRSLSTHGSEGGLTTDLTGF